MLSVAFSKQDTTEIYMYLSNIHRIINMPENFIPPLIIVDSFPHAFVLKVLL
jgi:hypothetical protein